MNKILTLFALLAVSVTISAQKTIDILYLIDGSIIKGKVTENTAEITKIETECGNTYVYKNSEIQKTEKLPNTPQGSIKPNGYFNFTSMGVLIGSSLNEKPAPLSVLMEHNYRINRFFAPGILTGIELLNESVVPIGINLKFIAPLNKSSNLFAGLSGGYSFSLDKPETMDGYYKVKKAYGGYMYTMELGLILKSTGNSSFFVALGYRYGELSYKREDWYMTTVDRKMIFNRLSLRLGLTVF